MKQEIKSQGKYEKLRAMGNILPENSEEEMAFFTFFNNFCLFEAYFIDLYIHSILHFAEKNIHPPFKRRFNFDKT